MYQYVLLLVIPVICSVICGLSKEQTYLDKIVVKQSNPLLITFFICLFLLVALRHECIGNDTLNYKYHFEKFSQQTYSNYPIFSSEWLFKWINIFIGSFTKDSQIYFAVVAGLTLLPIAFLYCNQDNGYLQMVIFVNMSNFVMLFSGVRQSLAISLGIIAYQFVKRKKLVWFLLFAYLAVSIHHSGFMIFLMYPIYHIKVRKQYMIIVAFMVSVVFIFRGHFTFLTNYLSEDSDKYGGNITETGAYMSLLLFLLITIFIHFVTSDEKMDAEAFGLRNFLILTIALQSFATLHTLAMRLNYYYIIFIPYAVSKCLNYVKDEYKDIAKLGKIVLSIFFTIYFIWTTYNSFRTGQSDLNTVPYKFFWEI